MEREERKSAEQGLDIYSAEGRRKLEAHAMLAGVPLETAKRWVEEHNARIRGEPTREERIARMDPELRRILRENDLI